MSTEAKKEKICENCFYKDIGLFDYPCRDCVIDTNSNWKEEEDFVPEWMKRNARKKKKDY